jgi:hypothetical protein
MKIFHSDLTTKVALRYKELQPNKPLRGLISYGRRGNDQSDLLLSYRTLFEDLIMDSGTFTLFQNRKRHQKSITFKGYRSYINLFADKVDFYFNFDEDFSPDGFEKNFGYQLDLESRGFKPLPVIHDCYGPEIQCYIDRGHKLVSIGSGELAYASKDELYRIVNNLYEKGVLVHFLGCTQYEKLAYIPVYSADSTTWNRAGTASRIYYWNPARYGDNKMDEISLNDKVPIEKVKYHIRDYPFIKQLEDYLFTELRLTVDDIVNGEKRYLNRCLVNIHYFVLLEELINQKHKEQGFTFE